MYQYRSFPPLTPIIKNLLIVNALIFFAQLTFQGKFDIDGHFALHHFLSKDFRPHQLITYMLLHGSWSHLFGNMLGLYIFGAKLELVWGPKRFLSFYIICGIGAGLISGLATLVETYPVISDLNLLMKESTVENFNLVYNKQRWFDPLIAYRHGINSSVLQQFREAMNASPNDPIWAKEIFRAADQIKDGYTRTQTVGASGSIFGLLAGAAYLFPNETINLYFLIPIQLKWFALLYAGGEVWLALQNDPRDQVAHVAHIGGALVGFLILYFYYRRPNRRKLF